MGRIENPFVGDLDEILLCAKNSFSELRGSRIFITGGTGFWGRWILESLFHANRNLGLGIRATILTRFPRNFGTKAPHLFDDGSFELIQGDIRNFDFPDGNFTDVIHCATPASARLNADAPVEMFDTIVSGTRRILDFAVKSGTRRFLLASSGAVYGRQPPEFTHITEDFRGGPYPADTGSAYAEGKRSAEFLCATFRKEQGIEVKIARGFAFVGPFLPLDEHYAIGNFIRDGLAGGPIIVKGDGTPRRSYMYATDLVIWLLKILVDGKCCAPYNVGSDNDVTIGKLAHDVAESFPHRPGVIIQKKPSSGVPCERYVPSTEKARSELALSLNVNLNEAIKRTVSWHLKK